MGHMLSIGEVAHRTAVSRRMLRHWEDVGLLTPVAVDEHTGYRRYAPSQVGRVRAIAALRAVGFGLGEIADLLSGQLTNQRLVELLHARERELSGEIAEASARLDEVRRRLTALQEGHRTIVQNLELGPLPALRLASLTTVVADESEIGDAIVDLLPRLRSRLAGHAVEDAEIVLTYDGTQEETIVVTAGVPLTGGQVPGLDTTGLPGAERGATVRFDTSPSVGDAWLALDAHLEGSGVQTTGVYRQVLTRDGGVVLAAPVRDLAR